MKELAVLQPIARIASQLQNLCGCIKSPNLKIDKAVGSAMTGGFLEHAEDSKGKFLSGLDSAADLDADWTTFNKKDYQRQH